MQFVETPIQGLFIIEPFLFEDNRGWFFRSYCKNEFKKIGFDKEWVQMNDSFTKQKGTIRGLHFQYPPAAESKLVRCIKGSIFDVAVDLRQGSPTFFKWFGVELSEKNKKILFIPEGFAHGFQALTDDCEVLYNHSNFYSKENESALRYNEPRIGVRWPLPLSVISDRDANHPLLTNDFNGIKQ